MFKRTLQITHHQGWKAQDYNGTCSNVERFAFGADILQGKSPTESCFYISRMRKYLIECLEKEKLSVFPK